METSHAQQAFWKAFEMSQNQNKKTQCAMCRPVHFLNGTARLPENAKDDFLRKFLRKIF